MQKNSNYHKVFAYFATLAPICKFLLNAEQKRNFVYGLRIYNFTIAKIKV